MRTFSPDVRMQTRSITSIIEHAEVADEFITSENPDLTRVFIIKARHPDRLKKADLGGRNRSGNPGHIWKTPTTVS